MRQVAVKKVEKVLKEQVKNGMVMVEAENLALLLSEYRAMYSRVERLEDQLRDAGYCLETRR